MTLHSRLKANSSTHETKRSSSSQINIQEFIASIDNLRRAFFNFYQPDRMFDIISGCIASGKVFSLGTVNEPEKQTKKQKSLKVLDKRESQKASRICLKQRTSPERWLDGWQQQRKYTQKTRRERMKIKTAVRGVKARQDMT